MQPRQYEGEPKEDEVKANAVAVQSQSPKRFNVMQWLRGQFPWAMGFSHHGQRDLYKQFGYPRLLNLDTFVGMYERNDIATRIIRAFPAATWRDPPSIYDEAGSSPNPEDEDYSPFVENVDDLFETFQIWSVLEKVDRLSSIGQYGLLVLGFNDAMAMDQPLTGNPKLIYLQAYMQRNITVQKFVTDPKDPRFGKPEYYTVQTGAYGIQQSTSVRSFRVHHSRCIHIAEFLDQDDTFGMPRLEPVINRLMDLEKVIGGSAEMYWLNASRGVALTADADANIDGAALADMKSQLDEFDNQLRRNLALQGVTATQLQTAIEDASPVIGNILDLIAGSIGMPKRIMLGSEMGQLASGQDENNWADRTNERRKTYAGPRILKPFLRIMIDTGNLIEPAGQFWIDWPDSAASPEKQANLGNTRSTMLRNYCSTPGAEIVVPVAEFRKDFMGLPPVSDYEETEEDEELKEATAPAPPVMPGEQKPLDEDDEEVKTQFKKSKSNAKPKSMYVYRPVENAEDIIDWYKSQGVKTTLTADEMHVTIMYSTKPVDWMKAREPYNGSTDADREKGVLNIAPGGPRDNDMFGGGFGDNDQCLVALFASSELQWRHMDLTYLGAESKYATFQPHITITWEPGDIDLDDIKPWKGPIVLGPEQFETINKNWKAQLVENLSVPHQYSIAHNKKWKDVRVKAKTIKPRKLKPDEKLKESKLPLPKGVRIVNTRGKAKTTKGKANYSPDQERDDDGRFGDGAGGGDGATKMTNPGEGKNDFVNVAGFKTVADASLSKPLSGAQKDAIMEYTGDSYAQINEALRTGTDPDVHATTISRLDKAFDSVSLSEPITAYRTVDSKTFAQMQSGMTFSDAGFVSTSVNPDIKDILGGSQVVTVKMPAGSKALPIAHLASDHREGEVLIARGSKFKVSGGGDKKTLTLEE